MTRLVNTGKGIGRLEDDGETVAFPDVDTTDLGTALQDGLDPLSRQTTLEPGDVISTGTPVGVGHKPGLFLRSGTEVRIEIEGIGALVNICA